MLAIIVQESNITTGRLRVFIGPALSDDAELRFRSHKVRLGPHRAHLSAESSGSQWKPLEQGLCTADSREGEALDGSEGVTRVMSAAAVANRVSLRSVFPFPSATEPDCWNPGPALNTMVQSTCSPCRRKTHGVACLPPMPPSIPCWTTCHCKKLNRFRGFRTASM